MSSDITTLPGSKVINKVELRQTLEWTVFEKSGSKLENNSLSNVFSKLKTSTHIPFISFNNVHKVEIGFVPPNMNWIHNYDIFYNKKEIEIKKQEVKKRIEDQESKSLINKISKQLRLLELRSEELIKSQTSIIKLKHVKTKEYNYNELSHVNNYVYSEIENQNIFRDITIYLKDGSVTIQVKMEEDYKKYKNITEIQDDISDILGSEFKIKDSKKSEIAVQFDIEESVDEYIFLDMITNDVNVSKYLSVDELLSAKKEYMTIGYHDNGKIFSSETFTFTLTEQYKDNGDVVMRVKTKKSNPEKIINNFITVISQILTYYSLNKKVVEDDYAKVGIVFDDEEEEETVKTEVKKKVQGIKRSCPANREAIYYDTLEEAVEQLDESIKDEPSRVLKYPDDETGKYYICDKNTEHKFPGFVKGGNTSINDKKIPCCYKKDQSKSKKSSEKKPNTKNNKLYSVKGDTAVPKGRTGFIPDSLSFLEKYTEYSGDEESLYFRRMGVDDSSKSLFSCIEESLREKREGVVPNIVNELNSSTFNLAKQEMYFNCTDTIQKIFRDNETYADPRLCYSLIEEFYKIKLIVFSKNGIVSPQYKHSYYKRENNYPVVILYEQENTPFKWPILELVVLNGTEYKTFFDQSSEISKEASLIFSKRVKINYTDIKIPSGWVLVSQCFDSFGKTRILTIQEKTTLEMFKFQTSPLQPYQIPVDYNIQIQEYTEEQIGNFEKIISLILGEKYTKNIKDSHYSFKYENTEIKIPVKTKSNTDISIITKGSSQLNNYIKKEREARIIMECCLWLISKLKLDKPTDIEKFVDENTTIQERNRVGYTKKFETNKGVISQNSLILPSEEVKKRIKYYLQITNTRSPGKIKEYEKMTYIPNYFEKPTDYKIKYSQKQSDNRDLSCLNYEIFNKGNVLEELLRQKSIN